MAGVAIQQIPKRENMSNLVAKEIMDLIVNGQYKPGERLPTEKDFCEQLGVGRNTLREAIRALSILGFVEVRVPEGTFVADSLDNFFVLKAQLRSRSVFDNAVALAEARAYIEKITVRLAALKATESDKCALAEVMDMHVNAEDSNRRRECDARFHLLVAEIAGNPFITQMLLLLIDEIYEWIGGVLSNEPSANTESIQQHKKIYECIARNDPDGAEEAMSIHMRSVTKPYLSIKNKDTENKELFQDYNAYPQEVITNKKNAQTAHLKN
ncbi:MAG: FadR family transcriptional regulator [Firmicutes bacterium]|nr:FadR family transcriptional regulator [Bacillota bacterium]